LLPDRPQACRASARRHKESSVDKRFILFLALTIAVLAINQVIAIWLFPPPPAAQQPAKIAKADPKQAAPKQGDQQLKAPDDDAQGLPAAKDETAKDAPAENADKADAEKPAAPPVESQRVALGSGDPGSPYRMLVYLLNDGAAVERLEMNSPQYRNLENRSGYLGYLAPLDSKGRLGALVRVVGPGTPAALAGIKPGDIVTKIGNRGITATADIASALSETEPGQTIPVVVQRDGAAVELKALLIREPLAVIRPEHDSAGVESVKPGNHDPLSFLMTLHQFDDQTLSEKQHELAGVEMLSSPWEVVSADETAASFRKKLPNLGLEITKTYRLQKVPSEHAADPDYPAYNLVLDVSVANTGDAAHRLAYRLGGPTGLPIEGEWYAIKVSRNWGSAGLRDVVVRFRDRGPEMVTAPTIAAPEFDQKWSNTPLDYIAVDAQYFAVGLIPKKRDPNDLWFSEVRPIRAGPAPSDKANYKLTNVSFQLTSQPSELAPGGPPLEHRFEIFAGPKRPNLLAEYDVAGTSVSLRDLVYYGWFGFVARPMLAILHAFHTLVGNFGVAIIMLTVLVRLCMFPLSRKQALSAQKMQELQPEIKKLNEKFKNDAEKKMRAQQQLFREHNYHPLGGCLLAFVQLPIFVGLYRSLSVDVALRQAPLFSEQIRWASNLAAPDMFWNWTGMMPEFITQGTGFFVLGPYLNILPLVTIVLFIWQQKMFMPPPADEQAAMQQKMMRYMMIFMGVLFFKVASGLCVYFIASSLWGIAERKLLPKAAAPAASGSDGNALTTSLGSSGNGAALRKKRQKGRK
jgi:YidC/Oxa1 family membrane protein insertase